MKKIFFTLLTTLLFCCAVQAQYAVHVGDVLCTDNSIVQADSFAGSGKTAMAVVFYVDTTGAHGWAVNLTQRTTRLKWDNQETMTGCSNIEALPDVATSAEALADYDGYENTRIIRATDGATHYPVAYSVDIDNGWYLPAAGQLSILYANLDIVQNTLNTLSALSITTSAFTGINYWSSSEASLYYAWYVNYKGELITSNAKCNAYYVRSCRTF